MKKGLVAIFTFVFLVTTALVVFFAVPVSPNSLVKVISSKTETVTTSSADDKTSSSSTNADATEMPEFLSDDALLPDEAAEIALADLKLTQDDVTMLSVAMSHDYRPTVYTVSFYADSLGSNFEYQIEPYSGAILQRMDHRNLACNAYNDDGTQVATFESMVWTDQAKGIAFDDAKVDYDDLTFYYVEAAQEDGTYLWLITFSNGKKDYTYKIDQTDGAILESASVTAAEPAEPTKKVSSLFNKLNK